MKTEIIAEIGVNHQNDLDIALRLMAGAKAAGATVVKFQASTVVEEVSFKAAPDHFKMIGALVPTDGFLLRCRDEAAKMGIEFMCTPAGLDSLRFVRERLDCRRLKISSDNLNNVEFLRAAGVAYADREIILSTGMGTEAEIFDAIITLRHAGKRTSPMILPLQCVSVYPCPVDRIGLRVMASLLEIHGTAGLSDHTTSEVVPALAVALGASLIEKHITLDRNMPGPDHAASLDVEAFARMVANVREAEAAMTDIPAKRPLDIEAPGIQSYRKSLVARRPIKAGEEFTPENVTAKRPGTGIPASYWGANTAGGLKALRDFAEDELLDYRK